MTMDATWRGSCLCGGVRFEVTGTFDAFFLCHCVRCQKDTGSAHAANLFSSSATLTWLAGASTRRTYRVPGTRHVKSFCPTCGSAVPVVRPGSPLAVPAGCLDDPVDMRPTAHICTASRAGWDRDLTEVASLPGLPT